MQCHTFGVKGNPTVVLLHGAGLSWWGYQDAAALLAKDYYVVLPLIDGYGDAADEPFQSIEHSAEALLGYLNAEFQGHVFALGGLSLGAQIAVETLRRAPTVADYAVIESALVDPIPGVDRWMALTVRMSFGLLKHRWFARLQANALLLPDALFETYYRDSLRVTPETLLNTLKSNNAYTVRPGLADTRAKALVIAGGREMAAMRKSAQMLAVTMPGSELWVAEGMKHGELSLRHPQAFVDKLKAFWGKA